MKFQDSSFNGLKVTVGTKSVTHARTHACTHARTRAHSKSNMPHQLFQSWGHKNVLIKFVLSSFLCILCIRRCLEGLKFRIKEEEELNYTVYVEKTKMLISFAVTTELMICAFVLAYAKTRFSHAAQLLINLLANFYYATLL